MDFAKYIKTLVRTKDSTNGTVVKISNRRGREINSFANQVSIYYMIVLQDSGTEFSMERTIKFSSNNTGNKHFEELKLLASAS